jgi:hypothetical protein
MSQSESALEHPVLAGVRAANNDLDKACRTELWQALDDEVETALGGVLAAEARLAALRGALLREADARVLRARSQALSTAGWLQDRFRLSRSRADRLTEQAAGLGRHPQLDVALVGAALGEEHATIAVQILDRAAGLRRVSVDDVEAAAELLVEHGGMLDPRRLRRAGEQLLEDLAARAPSVDDPAEAAALERERESAEDALRRAETNTMRVRRRPDGRARGSFELSPLGAAALVGWLTHADKRHPGTDSFEDTRPRDQRRGDALIDALLTHLAATGQHPGGNAEVDAEVDADGRGTDGCANAEVDGFLDANGAFLDGTGALDGGRDGVAAALELPGLGLRPTAPAPPRARIGVTITLDALRAGLAGAGLLDTGGTLSAAELRRLACQAAVIPIVLGGDGQVLDVGRATRTWNPAQERGIYARDRACVAPGCDRPPAACQIHHRWAWADGGPTDIANSALLCLFHHQQVHRQGWTVTMAANGYPQLIPPDSIDPDRRPRQHHRFRLTLLTNRQRT